MLNKLRKRLRSEKGFTLIELLVVMIILGILTAIAIPSYLSFRDRANNSAAGADLRAVIPSVEAYFSDNGSYTGMTAAVLKASYDQSIDTNIISVGTPSGTTLLRSGDVAERHHEGGLEGRAFGADRRSAAPARKRSRVDVGSRGRGRPRPLSFLKPRPRSCRAKGM